MTDGSRSTELLAGADVALNPMRTGGGSNLKVLAVLRRRCPGAEHAPRVRGHPTGAAIAAVARSTGLSAAIAELVAESLRQPDRWQGGGGPDAGRDASSTGRVLGRAFRRRWSGEAVGATGSQPDVEDSDEHSPRCTSR